MYCRYLDVCCAVLCFAVCIAVCGCDLHYAIPDVRLSSALTDYCALTHGVRSCRAFPAPSGGGGGCSLGLLKITDRHVVDQIRSLGLNVGAGGSSAVTVGSLV